MKKLFIIALIAMGAFVLYSFCGQVVEWANQKEPAEYRDDYRGVGY